MQSTGQTATQAVSLVPMHGSVMICGIVFYSVLSPTIIGRIVFFATASKGGEVRGGAWHVLPSAGVQYLSLIHISEPTRRTPISYAVFCLKKKKKYEAFISKYEYVIN